VLEIELVSFAEHAYPGSLFRLYAADPRAVFLVAKIDHDAIVGYIITRLDRWGVEVVSLAVRPEARRQGIGRSLLASAIQRSLRRHARSVRLMVRVDNVDATRFYRAFGFRSIGRIRNYYEDGSAGIRMRLGLAS